MQLLVNEPIPGTIMAFRLRVSPAGPTPPHDGQRTSLKMCSAASCSQALFVAQSRQVRSLPRKPLICKTNPTQRICGEASLDQARRLRLTRSQDCAEQLRQRSTADRAHRLHAAPKINCISISYGHGARCPLAHSD